MILRMTPSPELKGRLLIFDRQFRMLSVFAEFLSGQFKCLVSHIGILFLNRLR